MIDKSLPESIQLLKDNVSSIILGKEEVFELLLIGLLTGGHVLMEDVPGVGKTMITKAMAGSFNIEYKRLQCTPDLTPTDVTGFNIYERDKGEFSFKPGPVITNILLVDEINRAVPRTQSSLLEAMEEKQITIDGDTIILDNPFFVVATQNPIEHEGTFPLPEAQLDRFLFKISVGYPNEEEEIDLLTIHGSKDPFSDLQPVCSKDDILLWQKQVGKVHSNEQIKKYIVDIIRNTREHPAVDFGASPRASLALFKTSKALAFLRKREYVIPDDVKYLAGPILAHRLAIKREEKLKGVTVEQVIKDVLETSDVLIEESTN